MTITLSRTWEVNPEKGFIKVEYKRGEAYPILHDFVVLMPPAFDLNDPNNISPNAIVPLLSGFDINWLNASGGPANHELRQLRIDLQSTGWYSEKGPNGPVAAGPNLRAIVGIRDNSGGDPPDDPFVAWLHVSALVVFDYELDTVVARRTARASNRSLEPDPPNLSDST
jgi:hypothetical protein